MGETTSSGRFVWRELLTTDRERALKFYGDLLGWTSSDMDMGPMGTYSLVKAGEADAGGVMKAPDGVPPNWLNYLGVDDVDAFEAKAKTLGATVMQPAFDIPNVGRASVVIDPQGAAFALFKSAHPPTPEPESPAMHSWCWSQLLSADPEASAAFYSGLFGWEANEMPGVNETQTYVFLRGGKMHASVMGIPEGAPAQSAWLNYIAVEEVEPVYNKVESLGGARHKEPTTLPNMGRYAVISDPGGAMFALWKDLGAGSN